MARYKDKQTGRYISIDKARRLGKTIYKIDSEGRSKISGNFRPPPVYSGLKIRDVKTGKYVNIKEAAGKWVRLEKWGKGKRLETGKVNLYSSEELEKIKKRLVGRGGGGGGGEDLGLIQEYERLKNEWGNWSDPSERAYTVSQSTDLAVNTFRENLNKKKQKQFDENRDLIDNLVLQHIFENTTDADIDDMSFQDFNDFIGNYLNEIGDNLDDLEAFTIPF